MTEAKTPIVPPRPSKARTWIRLVVDSALSAIPYLGGASARLLAHLMPSQRERLARKWQEQVSQRVNTTTATVQRLEAILLPSFTLKGLALELATQLLQGSTAGMQQPQPLQAFGPLLPGPPSEAELLAAAHELQHHGLISINPVRTVRIQNKLYETLDPLIMGSSQGMDARRLAGLVLADERCQSVRELFKLANLPIRRFNPAVAYLFRFCPRVSQELQNEHPTLQFFIGGEERYALQQFLDAVDR